VPDPVIGRPRPAGDGRVPTGVWRDRERLRDLVVDANDAMVTAAIRAT
jgi:hypothetical protein